MHNGWDPEFLTELLEGVRDATGLSQRQIAALAGVHHAQVSRWKTGTHRPSYESMVMLAGSLHEKYAELGDLTAPLLHATGRGAGFEGRGEDVLRTLREASITSLDSARRARNGGPGA